jgi:ribosome biogenesis protein Tsr3
MPVGRSSHADFLAAAPLEYGRAWQHTGIEAEAEANLLE